MIGKRLTLSAALLLSCWSCGHDKDRAADAPRDDLGGAGPVEDSGGSSSGGGSAAEGGSPTFGGSGGQNGRGGSGGSEDPAGSGGSNNSTGGAGGSGGFSGCGLLERALCDDGNDCTKDVCEESGCQHEELPDGTLCDDSNACTANDVCHQGACTGEATASEGKLEGELHSFGSSPAFDRMDRFEFTEAGLTAVLNDELVVFTETGGMTSLSLILVKKIDGQLKSIDRIATEFFVQRSVAGLWPTHINTHLVRLNEHRFALIDGFSGIAVYEADHSGLSLVGERKVSVDGVGTTVWDADGHGNRLWLLDSDKIHAYDIAADGTSIWLSSISVSDKSSAFAASADGNLLYVGGQKGTYRIDASNLERPIIDDSPLIAEASERRPRHMSLQGDLLFIQSEGLWSEIGDARLYGGPDLELIQSFPSTLEVDSPLGGTFTDDGLLLHRLLYKDFKPGEIRAELYAIEGQELKLSDSFTYADLSALEQPGESSSNLLSFPPVAQGSLAILGHRVVSTAAGKIEEINGPLQGSFETVRAVGKNQVLAFGSESSQLISLGPAGPSLIDGGLHAPATSGLYSLVFREAATSTVGTAPPLLVGHPDSRATGGRFAWLEAAAGQAAQAQGFFDLPGAPFEGYAYQFASDHLLFRQQFVSQHSFTLQVFALPQSANELNKIESLDPVDLTAVMDLRERVFAINPDGRSFVIAGNDADTHAFVFHWYELEEEKYQLAASFHSPRTEGYLKQLYLRNDMLVFSTVDNHELGLLQRDASGLQLIATRIIAENILRPEFHAFLGGEGDRIYVSGLYENATEPDRLEVGIDALNIEDLTTVAHYVTPQAMTSMTVSGETLVFGGPSVLLTASPACRSK